MVTYLTFTYLTDELKEMYLRATLHRSLQKTKRYDGADDCMPPVITFSKTRRVCTSEKLIDSLDILAVRKTYRWTFHKYCASICFVHTNLISVCTDEEIACTSWTMQSAEFHNKWMVWPTFLADESETWALNFCLSRLIPGCTVVTQVSIIGRFISIYTSGPVPWRNVNKICLFSTAGTGKDNMQLSWTDRNKTSRSEILTSTF